MTYASIADMCDADKRTTHLSVLLKAGRISAHAMAYTPRHHALGQQLPPRPTLTDDALTETSAALMARQMLAARVERHSR